MAALFDFAVSIDLVAFERCAALADLLRRCVADGAGPPADARELADCDAQVVVQAAPQLKDAEIESFVGSVRRFPYESTRARFDELLDDVNERLPLGPVSFRLDVFAMHRLCEVVRVNDATLCVRVTAFQKLNACMIVERVRDACAAETWAAGITAIRGLFALSFNARQRAFAPPVQSNGAVAVGPHFVMSYCGVGRMLRCADFAGSGLADHFAARYAQKELCRLRTNAVESFGAWAVLRAAFALPRAGEPWIMENTGEIVMPLADFRIERRAVIAPANLCEQLRALFGEDMKGEVMLAMAAAAEALVENLEEFRSVVELLIRTDLGEIGWEELFELREAIVRNVLVFAPPVGPGAQEEDHIKWITALEEFVERSCRNITDDVVVPCVETPADVGNADDEPVITDEFYLFYE
jgi:hypothetical protein